VNKHYLTVAEKRAAEARALANMTSALGGLVVVHLVESNMKAGPCDKCREVGRQKYSAGDAPLPPFDGCSHPDQCACMWVLDSY
jgi:cytidine deaminase